MSCVSRPLPEFGRVIRIQNAPDDFVPGTVHLRQKNAGDKVPLIFLYQVRCPWKYLIAISASNLLPASDFTFSWLFLNQNFKPYPFIHINYNQWHSNVLKTPKIQWKLYSKVTQCYRVEENGTIVLGYSMPSALFVISLILVSLFKHS